MKHGTRVEVKSRDDSSPYITTVESVTEKNNCVLLDVMRAGGVETRLSPQKPYVLRFFSERGVFKFATVLRGYVKKGHYEYMLFQADDDGEKIQRRQSFRLSCGIDVDFDVLISPDTPDEEPDPDFIPEEIRVPKKGFIRDISSGGVRLLTTEQHDACNLIEFHLPMVADDFKVFGTILSKQAIYEAKYMWQYGVEFIGASDADVEKITMFVHNEQHKLRARS
jgi:c-di-GMP-binding flagellar brake protein YcgR